MLDTESDLNDQGVTDSSLVFSTLYKTATQKSWLASDLAAVNRSATPWIIVTGHRPFYTSREHGATAWMLAEFEPLFQQWGVDLVLGGHNHFYERMYPIRAGIPSPKQYNNLTTEDPPVYIVIGGAGNTENHYQLFESDIDAFIDDEYYGYMSIDFMNSTSINIQWHKTINVTTPGLGINAPTILNQTTNFVDEVIDELLLVRSHSIPAGGYSVISEPTGAAGNFSAAAAVCANATGARVCYKGWTISADLAVTPYQLVIDNNYDQTVPTNNAILTLEAYNSSGLHGTFQLQYQSTASGTIFVLNGTSLTSITLTGTVFTLIYAYGSGQQDPLATKCSGTPPYQISVSFDSVASVQTGSSAKTISYYCTGTSAAGYYAQGYFDFSGVTYGLS